jgi:hypothetical protein
VAPGTTLNPEGVERMSEENQIEDFDRVDPSCISFTAANMEYPKDAISLPKKYSIVIHLSWLLKPCVLVCLMIESPDVIESDQGGDLRSQFLELKQSP